MCASVRIVERWAEKMGRGVGVNSCYIATQVIYYIPRHREELTLVASVTYCIVENAVVGSATSLVSFNLNK